MDDRRWNARGELVTESEATVTLAVAGCAQMEVADGNGPVNALATALRKALVPLSPQLEAMRLAASQVRILTPQAATRENASASFRAQASTTAQTPGGAAPIK